LIGRILALILLSACIGEDYDAGPPEADLRIKEDIFSLQEANIDWKTDEKQYKNEVEDILTFGGKQKEINLQPNQTADLIFQENKENGGDYTE
jgi:hypothetical protein